MVEGGKISFDLETNCDKGRGGSKSLSTVTNLGYLQTHFKLEVKLPSNVMFTSSSHFVVLC